MNAKTLIILLILTAAAVWGVFELQQRTSPPVRSLEARTLYPGLQDQLNEVTAVRVFAAGDTLAAALQRSDDGWVVTSAHDYPADLATLRAQLLALAQARVIESKTDDPARYPQLGVQDLEGGDAPGVRIEVDGPEPAPRLIVGEEATSGVGQVYVRPQGEARSLLVEGNIDPPREARNWLRQPIVDIPGDTVQQVTIRHADGETLTLVRESREQTNLTPESLPPERELDYASVANPVGSALAGLQLESVRPAAELPPDQRVSLAKADFLTFDGRHLRAELFEIDGQRYLTLAAGFDAEQHQRFAVTEEAAGENTDESGPEAETEESPAEAIAALDQRLQGWAYTVSDYEFDNLTRRLEDLLKPPEESAETGIDDASTPAPAPAE
ncbi:MAG: DUF4340 domain-containing protein [Candidatus Competibacterales bacterium]|nr:DUF4340 domain-containing protein [Candidatus Competibacterales bacterium]